MLDVGWVQGLPDVFLLVTSISPWSNLSILRPCLVSVNIRKIQSFAFTIFCDYKFYNILQYVCLISPLKKLISTILTKFRKKNCFNYISRFARIFSELVSQKFIFYLFIYNFTVIYYNL